MSKKIKFDIFNFILVLVFMSIAVHIYGVCNWYTPIPFWDSWTSYLYFGNFENGKYWNYFFGNHNGHIIATHRVIEFIDWKLFHGRQYLTTLALAIFPIVIGVLFAMESRSKYGIISIIAMLSWAQKENFTWAFQGQMYLVIIFSILAFKRVCIYSKTKFKKDGFLYFIFSALSIVSMGNGIIVPALATMQFYFSNKNLMENKAFYFLNALLILLGLLLGLGGGSNLPVASMYEAIYSGFALSGSPVHYLLGAGKVSSLIVGLVIFLVSCYVIKNSNNKTLSTFIVFSWVTIFGIAYSRAAMEPSSIWYTSRYQGAIISLWIAVVIQISFFIKHAAKLIIDAVIILILIGSAKISLAAQFEDTAWYNFERSLAVVALLNGIDEKQVARIYPDLMVVRTLTHQVRGNCDGVFSSERFIDICMDSNSDDASEQGRANNLETIVIKKNVKLNEISFKMDEIDDWFKYFMVVDCGAQMRGRIEAIKIKTENKEILGIIGMDRKNFGDKCRIGFYAKSKIDEFENFDIVGVQR